MLWVKLVRSKVHPNYSCRHTKVVVSSLVFICMVYADELCSGIVNGRVRNLDLYTHRRQKLTCETDL